MIMKVLTIKQPWLYAITDLTKRIENRKWFPPQSVIGSRIGLHSAKIDDVKGYEWIYNTTGVTVPQSLPRGCLVATAIIAGYVEGSSDVWFIEGGVGWLLTDIVKLQRTIPCKGQLRLWNFMDIEN